MRRSLSGDEDLGAELPTVVRDRKRRARCVPDRPVNGGNFRSVPDSLYTGSPAHRQADPLRTPTFKWPLESTEQHPCVATLSGAGHAGSVDSEPGSPESRRQEEIRQRIGAIYMRIDELQAKPQDRATSATASERLASAQRHLAASQAAAEQAIAAAVRAFLRAAEAHERVAVLHERAAAAGSSDKDEHERQAAIHRAAVMADAQRAEHAQSLLRLEEADGAREPDADQALHRHVNLAASALPTYRLRSREPNPAGMPRIVRSRTSDVRA